MSKRSQKLLDFHTKNLDIRYQRFRNLAEILNNGKSRGTALEKLISLLEIDQLSNSHEKHNTEIIGVWDVLYSFLKENLKNISAKFHNFYETTKNLPEIMGEKRLERELIYDFHLMLIEKR